MILKLPTLDRKITDLLNERFTLSVEIVPPRNGASPQALYAQIEKYAQSGADFMAVTKGAGGSLRGGSLPIAQMVKDQFGLPYVAHFTCRDLLPEEVENQLVDHQFLGIRNILALRGDPPVGIEKSGLKEAREGSHRYAYELVEQISRLNHGSYLSRAGFATSQSEATRFCFGVACYPDEPLRANRIDHLKMKIDAGAEFAVSQMLLGTESYESFLEERAQAQIQVPIVPCTCIFRSKEQAQKLARKFSLTFDLAKIRDLPLTGVEAKAKPELVVGNFVKSVDEFQKAGAPGLHAFLIGSENDMTCQALDSAHRKIPSQKIA